MSNIELKMHEKLVGTTPDVVKQCIIRFLQEYFGHENSLLKFNLDPNTTEIHILDFNPDIETTDLQPCIFTAFQGAGWANVTNNQYLQDIYPINNETGEKFKDEFGRAIPSRLFADIFHGNMSCICRWRGSNTLQLASKVFLALTLYKEVVRGIERFFDLNNLRMSSERTVKSDSDEILSEVTIDFSFMYNVAWSITPTVKEDIIRHVTTFLDNEVICPNC